MKKLALLLLIGISFLSFFSCDPCLGTGFGECTDGFSFKIISKTSREDLVFGQSPAYIKDSVHLYSNLPNYLGAMSRIDGDKFYSTIMDPVDTIFLHLNQLETDTLLLSYKFGKSYCCRSSKGFGKVKEIKIKGVALPKEGSIYLIEK